MRQWSLDQLTVVGVRPVELVEVAARAGYNAISPFVGLSIVPGLSMVPLRAGDPETIGMARRLRDTGLTLNQADGFAITPDYDVEIAYAAVDLMADMGARNIVALLFDSDESRGFDRLAALCDKAEQAGIGVVLEFTALSKVPSLAAAVSIIERIGRNHGGLLIDLLHLAQSGESPADVAALPAGMVRGAQVCDALAGLDFDRYLQVAMGERMAPGTGELPVREFLAAIPPSVIIGVETPMALPADFTARAAMLLECARRMDTKS